MKVILSQILLILPCCCWLAAAQWTYRNSNSYRKASVYDPLEIVDFELMEEPARGEPQQPQQHQQQQYTTTINNNNVRDFGGRNKYDIWVEPMGGSSRSSSRNRNNRLPLLSRGERDLEEEEEEDESDYLLGEQEPSCQELRRMWRIARRIHNRAIKTNKIPQEQLHPFSEFESDR